MSHDPFAAPVPPAHQEPVGHQDPFGYHQPKRSNGPVVAVIVALVVAVVVLVGGVAVALWMFVEGGDEIADAAIPSPTASQVEEPASGLPADLLETPEPVDYVPFEPDQDALAHAEALGFIPVAYEMGIEQIHEYYSEAASSGELYEELIPATEDGADYVYAFMLAVTDYKAAGMFGATFDGQDRDEFADLELQFLTVSDMDLDIHITQSDGSVFEHDGSAPADAR